MQMKAIDFMDFGQRNNSCHVMRDGFVLWEITGKEKPVFLDGGDTDMVVHILMFEGTMKVGERDRFYPLTKGCLANFIDTPFLEIRDISEDTKAYAMLFTVPFMTSLLKGTLPFPPSYMLRIKIWPVSVISTQIVRLFKKRIESIVDIFMDSTHHFQTEMLRCTLWMFIMDMANEHIQQENENGEYAEIGRKNILFKQFIRLLFAHIHEEHSVGWYASQLCVTPQYLNRVVKSASQKTAYEHICTSLIGAIIEQLKKTESPVSQIAVDFHFTDQATLTKFFKRQTGKTPTEYRRMVRLL